jgi:hypothetical protein
MLLFGRDIGSEYGDFLVMLTMAIWCVGICLEVLVLVRGFQEKLYRPFPIFYGYLLFVTLDDFLRIAVYRWLPDHYFPVYWVTQFLSLAIGSGIIFEIYRVALRPFPGAARMARYLLLVVFGAIFARTLIGSSNGLFAWLEEASVVLERDLRIVQALAIAALVLLFVWYAIPFGRNLKGILVGYSLFVGMSILRFTLLAYSWNEIKSFWPYAGAVSFVVVLGIWARALWSLQPMPVAETKLESDYELLVLSTREQFRRTLERLGSAARV